jgi:hypothetical protein
VEKAVERVLKQKKRGIDRESEGELYSTQPKRQEMESMKPWKKKTAIALAAVIALAAAGILLLSRYPGSPQDSGDAKFQVNCAEQFLTQFYTTNYQDRYGKWLEDTAGETEEKVLSAAMERYYDSLRDLATEELMDTLQANREPMKYDKLCWEEGNDWSVEKLVLEAEDENARQKFSVERSKSSRGGNDKREGVIGLDAETGKVNYFWEKK